MRATASPSSTPGATSSAAPRCSPTCSPRSTCRRARAIAVQAEKSVEALILYLAVLRAGLRLPAAQHRLPERRDRLLHRRRRARASSSARRKNFAWVGRARLQRRHRRTCSRSATTAAAACSSARPHFSDQHTPALQAAPTTSPRSSTPAAPPGAARARC